MSYPQKQPPQHFQPPHVQNDQVVVPYVRQSQALPALVSFFLPGVGQLIQGRVIAWIVFSLAWGVGIASLCIGVGFVIVPFVALIATVEAAIYDPMRPPMAPLVAMLAVIGIATLAPIVFVLGLGGLVAATPPASSTSRPLQTIAAESDPLRQELEDANTQEAIELPVMADELKTPPTEPLLGIASAEMSPEQSEPAPAAVEPPPVNDEPVPAEPQNSKRRTWTSAGGTFSVEAGEHVHLFSGSTDFRSAPLLRRGAVPTGASWPPRARAGAGGDSHRLRGHSCRLRPRCVGPIPVRLGPHAGDLSASAARRGMKLLRTLPPAEVARRTGRRLSAVFSRRSNLKLADGRTYGAAESPAVCLAAEGAP